MNYNKLRYFYEVSCTLNLTRAAQNLYISQPALSKHIADLERDFGVPLFIRTNRNLLLTQAGEVLRDECRRIFDGEENLYRKVRSAATPEASSLSLAFMGIGAAYRIPDLLAQFHQRYPQISVQTKRLNWNLVYDAVESGACDVGLKLSSCETYPEHIARRVLREDRVAAVYPNVETVVMMVQAGAGVSLLSPFAPLQGLTGVVCIPLTEAPAISLDLLWRSDSPNEASRLFVSFASEFPWQLESPGGS